MKKYIKYASLILVVALLFVAAGCSDTAEYPQRAIKMIVPFGAGGGSDQFGRMLEQEVEAATDIEFTVVNVAGGATAVGFEEFMAEDADGYTICLATTDTIINLTNGTCDYDISEIEALIVPQLNVDMLFINSDEERFTTFEEMVAYSIENDYEITVATVGLDGSEYFTLSAISEVTGAKFTLVPYSEPAERYAALGGGHVDVMFEQPGDISSFLESGEYTPIIAMAEERLEDFPDVPTSIENGIDVTNGYWRGVLIKSDVPDDIKEILTEALVNAVETEAYEEYASSKYLDLREGYLDFESANEFIVSEFEYYSAD